VLASTPARAQAPDAAPLALTHVTVIDVERGSLRPDHTVLIAGNRIRAVAPSAGLDVPAGARVVDATGKYLIPGLWDMHVHSATSAERHFPLFLAFGITGVRNMHTTVDTALELTQAIKRGLSSGTLHGPRFLANGAIVDGPAPIYPNAVRLGSPAAARAAVDSLAAGGADFIKVYNRLPREVYFAVAEQAKRRGIPVVGHVPNAVRVAEAADAGQRSIEHVDALNFDCSAHGDSVRDAMRRRPPSGYQEFMRTQLVLARTQSLATCAPVIEALRRNGTWFVPTLMVFWAEAHPDAALADSSVAALVPAEQLRQWAAHAHDAPAWQRETARARFEAGHVAVGALERAGVSLLAGTDLGNPLLAPGYSLHQELGLLVDAGLTPLAALRTATLNPARFLEATDSLGTVDAGKLADLVLLEANPLDDITSTQRIAGVVSNGRYLDREALDALLATADARAPAP
jgi:imidazolonepropionase-like amidohydrolase